MILSENVQYSELNDNEWECSIVNVQYHELEKRSNRYVFLCSSYFLFFYTSLKASTCHDRPALVTAYYISVKFKAHYMTTNDYSSLNDVKDLKEETNR